jgi:hypothetical protein
MNFKIPMLLAAAFGLYLPGRASAQTVAGSVSLPVVWMPALPALPRLAQSISLPRPILRPAVSIKASVKDELPPRGHMAFEMQENIPVARKVRGYARRIAGHMEEAMDSGASLESNKAASGLILEPETSIAAEEDFPPAGHMAFEEQAPAPRRGRHHRPKKEDFPPAGHMAF